ncbi:MAG: hypothetical protein JXA96_14445 [Sedimentisphaerales bacterium]|nr:hypothetical protein [Sedimentisphaerales bacterium]
MKKVLMLSSLICLVCMGISFAQDTQPTDLQVKFDLTYGTKYVWRGFNVFGAKSAIHPTLDLFSPSTGVGFSVEGHRANSSGYENFERWDYSLYYHGKAFADELFEMNYRFAYVYYNYPQQSSHSKGGVATPVNTDSGIFDLHELHTVMSFPKLLGVEGLVPSYVLVKLMPVNSGTTVGANSGAGGTASGFAHIFMLDYATPYVCPLTGVDRKINWHTEFVFNDGVAPNGANADHDWSNAVFGATTAYDINSNVSLTPGMFLQLSFDDSVNKKDQLWSTLSLTCKF